MIVLISTRGAQNKIYIQILEQNNLDLDYKSKLCNSLSINYNKEYIYFYKTL